MSQHMTKDRYKNNYHTYALSNKIVNFCVFIVVMFFSYNKYLSSWSGVHPGVGVGAGFPGRVPGDAAGDPAHGGLRRPRPAGEAARHGAHATLPDGWVLIIILKRLLRNMPLTLTCSD